jgi:regulation of enolase protein 1 (concanavalin A-like superfamily)
MSTPTVSGLPALQWLNDLVGDASFADGALTMRASEKTDWFNPPPVANAPAGLANAPALVLSPPAGDWTCSARVSVQHRYLFDAGTLFVHQGPDDWCKLCFERSPEQTPTVVSVVTRGVSDDCNGATILGDAVHLRISRCGPVVAFHYSTDGGAYWTLHRLFSMRNPDAETAVGFLAQSPTGTSCTAVFSDIKMSSGAVQDFRDGS